MEWEAKGAAWQLPTKSPDQPLLSLPPFSLSRAVRGVPTSSTPCKYVVSFLSLASVVTYDPWHHAETPGVPWFRQKVVTALLLDAKERHSWIQARGGLSNGGTLPGTAPMSLQGERGLRASRGASAADRTPCCC